MSVEYTVKMTSYAIEQLQDAVAYISRVFLSPDVACAWADKIADELETLSSLPLRYSLLEDEPWHSEGVRRMVIQNFIAYYWIDEAAMTVWVTGIIYGRRDQLAALQAMPLTE
ncbi:MAG: type II toxin-antitoxin system RelE/ParE family toxin [Oscillospiraceae bacterium]|nr:type II toxin-antitoxin system RelE/ParE family toxin [Oscillospiraceae bacterium]